MVDYAMGLRYDELPAAVIHHAKRRVVDTLGGALAAYTAPPVRIARKLAVPVAGEGGARVWGSLVRTAPDDTVRIAVQLMAEHVCGSILVMTGDRLLGIFTERDLLLRVAAAARDHLRAADDDHGGARRRHHP